jgi:hypothetical protein
VTRTLPLLAFSAILFVCSLASSAQAQTAIRTYVSVSGSDTNPCSLTAPCRHFSAAVALTSAGGEVDALDPGGYGSFTIGQAISIEGQGWSYVAPADGGNAITVNVSSGAVSIRGVSLNGVGATGSTNGIMFNSVSGGTLDVQNSVIFGFSNDGIDFAPSANGSLYIADTLIAANALGVQISISSAVSSSTLDHVRVEKNVNNGISAEVSGTANMSVSISNSVMAGNGTTTNGCGLNITVLSGASDAITVTDDTVVNNGNGICTNVVGTSNNLVIRNSTIGNSVATGLSLTGGYATVTRSTITSNTTGISGSGTVYSFSDNNLINNITPGSFTSTLTYQ